jgi:hypothetical protein
MIDYEGLVDVFRAFFLTKILKKISLILCVHRADTPINMLYNAQDELDEWKIHKQLKESYGWEDDSKEWLSTVRVHHKKWKNIKLQSGKAAGSGRGGGGSGKKMQFSWKHVTEVNGEDLTIGGVWTQELAAQHFDVGYKFENDTPRSGNVSRDSEVFKCRKYIADVDGQPRIYIRVVEIEEGTEYKIEQGYPIGDNDDDDDDDPGSGPASEEVPSAEEDKPPPTKAKGRSKKAAEAAEAAPAPEAATGKKQRRK